MMGAEPLQEMMAAMLSFAGHVKSLLVCSLQVVGVSLRAALTGLAHLHASEESNHMKTLLLMQSCKQTQASQTAGALSCV